MISFAPQSGLAETAVATGIAVRIVGPNRVKVLRDRRVLFDGTVHARVDGARLEAVVPFTFRKLPALRIRLRGPAGSVELVLVRRTRRWAVIWSGRTGPLGPDGEVARVVETGPSRIVVYQTKRGLRRCDQLPVRLFPRAFDPKSWRMRPVAFRPDTRGIEVIQATAKPPGGLAWPAGLSAMRFVAASTHQGDGGRAEFLDRPRGIDDGDLSTMWAEERGGAGAGEFLDARSPAWPYELMGLVVVAANASSPRALAGDNRVSRFLLSFGRKQRFVIEIPDPVRSGRFPPVYFVLFPRPIRARCATVVLLSAYPGSDGRAGGRTVFSELRFLSRLDFQGGIGRLAKDVAAGRVDPGLALSVVRRLGGSALPRIRAALARSQGSAANFLGMAFLDLAPDRLGEIADRVASLSLPVRRRFALASGRFGDGDLLRKLLSDRTNEALGWLALQTAWKAGRHRTAARVASGLLDRVSETTARKLARMLIETKDAKMPQSALLGSSPSPLRVWTAGQRVLAGAASCASTAAILLPLWKKARTFRLRFRIVEALGWCLSRAAGWARAPGLRRETAALLENVIRRNDEELLRWAAVRAAGARGLGVELLRALLSDDAPRVRVAALKGLVQAGWGGAGPALLRCTLQDPWSWVRLECSSLLTKVCPRGIGPVLAGQVMQYGLGATVDLATVLTICRYREAWPLLKKILAGYRKGPWKAARAAALLAAAHRIDAVGQMTVALRWASVRAKVHGPFERLSLDLLGALDTFAGFVQKPQKDVLWRAVAFVLRRGSTERIRWKAAGLVQRHCPAGWRKMAGPSGRAGDPAMSRGIDSACATGSRSP